MDVFFKIKLDLKYSPLVNSVPLVQMTGSPTMQSSSIFRGFFTFDRKVCKMNLVICTLKKDRVLVQAPSTDPLYDASPG